MQPLSIGIDLTSCWRRPTGIFRYTTEMAKHLLMLPETEPALRYVFFFSHEVHPDFMPLRHAFEAVICPTSNELFVKQFWFPWVLPRLHLDIMHYPAFPPPYLQLSDVRTIITFHDAGPWRYPGAQTLHGRLYFRILLARGLRTSARVVTVSKHAKSEIGHFLGNYYLPKISIAPGAGRPAFGQVVSETCRQQVRADHHLPDSYFLTVSTVEPRKNLPTLFDAYTQLKQQLGQDCPTLVVVGRKGWNCEDILRYMAAIQEHVLFLDHISDQDLIAIYQMATCFIFPSLYEGFGLPVVEAMTAGCPVITTTGSSLPEVAGDAALLVDPLDSGEMARAMQRVLQDTALQQSMIAAGRIQAAHFSWEETAHIYRDVYLTVAASHNS
jgi:glycosyltransferase involved in cell wall biosynthesis